MGPPSRHSCTDLDDTPSPSSSGPMADPLPSPFHAIPALHRPDFREVAYEVFFTACRSSPGFGGRNALPFYNSSSGDGDGDASDSASSTSVSGPALVVSRVKRELGLKIMATRSRRSSSIDSNPTSPTKSSASIPNVVGFTLPSRGKVKRRTLAEIMKHQMKITDQGDNRLRKTLMRTLVGQMGRRAETIILPLELLRHSKPTEFNDADEYHVWQKRQLRILEAGLVLHAAIPILNSNSIAATLRDIADSAETKPIDTGRNSETMRTLCNCVLSLAWRCSNGGSNDVCHWADGYPLNVHIYTALLSSLFDETYVLDEVDELLELMKNTWSVLGITRSIHNLCFTWALFEQYVVTGQSEPDLLDACLLMLKQVASDAKKVVNEPNYTKMLPSVLGAMVEWCGTNFLDYHENFSGETIGRMETTLVLHFSSKTILDDMSCPAISPQRKEEVGGELHGNMLDYYIQSSMRNAFARMVENEHVEVQEVGKKLMKLAKKTEDLVAMEKEVYSPVLKKWHPTAIGVASMTLHTCYGNLLKRFLTGKSGSLNETLLVLQRAGKLENNLVMMVVEDSVDCEDGGKSIVRQMVPYDVDSCISRLLKEWIYDNLHRGNELILQAKQTESWNPKSKSQPYAQSAKDLMNLAKETLEKFFQISVGLPEEIFHDVVDGLDNVFADYISYVASCGSKQSYLPSLPPLTRCCHDSKLFKLWKKTTCGVGIDDPFRSLAGDGKNPHLSTSRGTQRLYIRLNTLYYLESQLYTLEKTLSSAYSKVTQSENNLASSEKTGNRFFEQSYPAFQVASHHVSEVAAYRLIFLDSYAVFYGSLYVRNVAKARITLALRILEQNLNLLRTIVAVQAQPLAYKEVTRAAFEGFLRVLLAGGNSRVFSQFDHPMIEEDLESLKCVFCKCGEGLVNVKDMVEKEAKAASGVVELVGQSTEQLVEHFRNVASDACGIGIVGTKPRITMPPTTGKWNRSDPNTILRVLCNRNDRLANRFLKKSFHLPKRKFANKIVN